MAPKPGEKTVAAVVLSDQIGWKEDDELTHTNFSLKGDEVDLPESEFERLSALGHVAKIGSKAAAAADEAPEQETTDPVSGEDPLAALVALNGKVLDDLAEANSVEGYPKKGSKADKAAALHAAGIQA